MSRERVVEALIEDQGELFSEEIGAEIAIDTPQELFHWLLGVVLLSARIDAKLAIRAARALRRHDFYKIEAILAADKWDIVGVLRENGYRRYDTVGAEYVKTAAAHVDAAYGGDLRAVSDRPAAEVLAAIKEVKGIGDVGAEIFAREVQLVWEPLYPRAEGPGVAAARDLGLPCAAPALADLAGSKTRFVRLMAALTRAGLDAPSPAVMKASGR